MVELSARASDLMEPLLRGGMPMPGLPPCLYYMMSLENF